MEVDDVEDDEVKGEEDDDVENDDVDEEENGDVGEDDVEEEDRCPTLCASLRRRNARGHVARATLCKNLQVKCRRREPAKSKCLGRLKTILRENLQAKRRRPRPGTTVCASLRSQNALDWPFHPFRTRIYK